ncbi:hypothetical protein [Ammoniphilus sp. 3BR4]|uniref:IS66 family insertion sequence element accessory protein TnpA n=1 Tax=Ammoniphilus sp. 3BR4 TaxID=3158265 RepID=UPI003465FACF
MTQIERRKEWEAKVASFKVSGQSVSSWCEEHDVKPHRLWYWIRKLEPKDAAAIPSVGWMAVEVREQPNE